MSSPSGTAFSREEEPSKETISGSGFESCRLWRRIPWDDQSPTKQEKNKNERKTGKMGERDAVDEEAQDKFDAIMWTLT